MKLVRRLSVGLASVACILGGRVEAQGECPGDLGGDTTVGAADLSAVLAAWGPCAKCSEDLTGDGEVDGSDLAVLFESWGEACSPLTWGMVIEFAPDPSVILDEALRAGIEATGLPWRVRDQGTGIEMLLVPPGSFTMGCTGSRLHGCSGDELPVHGVELTEAFYIGRFEVTQAQWMSMMGSNPSQFQGADYPDSDQRPVERMGWVGVQDFLSRSGLRLPTEAEWEFAYRAGTTTAFHALPGSPSGTDTDAYVQEIAWWSFNSDGQTQVVGGKAANGLGLHDMSGNVAEFVSDLYDDDGYPSGDTVDPLGPTSGGRSARGGGYDAVDTRELRASDRQAQSVSLASPGTRANLGFRVARGADAIAPTVASIAPSSGPATGGTQIVIAGANLGRIHSVSIGTRAVPVLAQEAGLLHVQSAPEIHGAIRVPMSLHGPDGVAHLPNAFTYTYPAPTVVSVSPHFGRATGGTRIAVQGANLGSTTSVLIGGALATELASLDGIVYATTPAGVAGSVVDVVVTTGGGTATLAGAFAYDAPPIVLEQDPDPAIITDPAVRAAILATGLPWRLRDTRSQIELLLIPPGDFAMGCSASAAFGCAVDETPLHAISITRPFYLGRHEVTQAQWFAIMSSNPSVFQGPAYSNALHRPVESIAWDMVTEFLLRSDMRLPTEAEWEYAGRAGVETAFHAWSDFPSGTNEDTEVGSIAWYWSNSGAATRAVGLKAANAYGLHDMCGNVHEYVSDRYSATYYANSPAVDPQGPDVGSFRTARGGGWVDGSGALRLSARRAISPNAGNSFTGFRVVWVP